MAEVFKTIFEMEGQGNSVLKELDDIKAKYTGVNNSMREQQNEIDKLVADERRLSQARKESSNPTLAAKYNDKISDTRNRISDLQKEMAKLKAEEVGVANSAETMQTKITKAMDTTKVNALNTSLQGVEDNLKDTGKAGVKAGADTAKAYINPIRQVELLKEKIFQLKEAQVMAKTAQEFNKLTKEIKDAELEVKKYEAEFTDNPIKRVESLRTQLVELKKQIALSTNPEDFARLSKEAGTLQDKITSASNAAASFASNSKFTVVGNQIQNVVSSLLQMDFSQALDSSRLLVEASKAITFQETLQGVKQLGETLFNVGRALLTNPIFLIGAAVIGIIANFDKLKQSGGLLGSVFKGIGKIIEDLTKAIYTFTDAIGLTEIALQKLNQVKLDNLAKNLDNDLKTFDRFSKLIKSLGRDVEETEKQKQKAIIESTSLQIDLLREITKNGKQATDEQRKQFNDLSNTLKDAMIDLVVIENESNATRMRNAKKYADDKYKIFDDLDKRLRAVQATGEEFNISFRTDPNSVAQLERAFALRKKLEDQELKDLRESTLKALVEAKASAKDKADALAKIDAIAKQTQLNRDQEYEQQRLEIVLASGQKETELRKVQKNKELDIFKAETLVTEFIIANERLTIQKKYYEDSIKLLENDIAAKKKAGLNTLDAETALYALRLDAAVQNAISQDEVNKLELADRIKSIDAEDAHVQSKLVTRNSLQSKRIQKELEAERSRLAAMIQLGESEVEAIQAKEDRIRQLEKEAARQRLNEAVDNTKKIVDSAISAANQILSAKEKEISGVIALQEKRVEEIKNIASQGNAEMLEEEKKRLDALNKERAKYVRAQQALAVIELIANTAVMISKAAAEGGVLAGVTIAAALIALVGGLVAARQTASQAAYYEGGYTGDGNARSESNTMDGKATVRPYTWHKKEFVVNHKATEGNVDIFRDINAGKINLRDMKTKSIMFDSMQQMDFNKKADIFFNNSSNHNSDFSKLESKLDGVIDAVRNQERALIQMNGEGFSMYLTNIEQRKSMIANLAT